eukprot:CAMPEP_0204594954 /NCGR_PEP_ID=MMETSP0661-20131031/52381_1 /ASSEMBLY_ACC=CAM_ASM_000606 /TAXON_ID=109239 /ORGANISM="Alexandrium margalefi, Strain AMGDE01CS-322" /LENGTH=88 /DNA_ID=CAMNT_0051605413 /DNA_START=179 /DNA_END=445 /DNA_ORIENTATION=-
MFSLSVTGADRSTCSGPLLAAVVCEAALGGTLEGSSVPSPPPSRGATGKVLSSPRTIASMSPTGGSESSDSSRMNAARESVASSPELE